MTDLRGHRHPPLRAGWIDRPHETIALGDFRLESGAVIADCHLSYVTHGHIDARATNVILVLTAIGATHHRLDFLIGPGRALDPERYFILCVDALGNGLSSSPSNSHRQPGMQFPRFSIRDMVESQRLLLDRLAIDKLHAVCGASMGGMQVLQWGASHPNRAARLVAMTPMAQTSAWSRLVNELARRLLLADPTWDGARFNGRPERGWRSWAGIMRLLAVRTPQGVTRMGLLPATAVADIVAEVEQEVLSTDIDPIDWIYQSWAYDDHDLATTPGCGGSLEAALRRITAPTLVLAPPLDLYNPSESARQAAALIPRARYVEIPSVEGHQAAAGVDSGDARFLNTTIREFVNDETPHRTI